MFFLDGKEDRKEANKAKLEILNIFENISLIAMIKLPMIKLEVIMPYLQIL